MKFSEWQSPTGKWHTGNVYAYWWYVPRMLNITPCDYILLLKNKFHAKNFYYNKDKNFLTWDWENYKYCHSFTLWVNKQARERKYYI